MKPYRKARIIRTIAAVVVLTLTTLSLCDYVFAVTPVGRSLVHLHFVPAMLSLSGVWVALWLAMAYLFGRIYCSVVCPMGIFMDICARLPKVWRSRRRDYHYAPARNSVRYTVLAVVCVLALAGIPVLLVFLDPLSVYSRAITFGGYDPAMTLAGEGGHIQRAAMLFNSLVWGGVVSVAVLLAVALTAWRSGRSVCNTICPVGALFSLPAAYSFLHMDINTDLCTNCYRCVHVCKSHCIDLTSHLVDTSRCVVCLDCTAECPNEAITYRQGNHRLGMPLIERVARRRSPIVDLPGASTASCEIPAAAEEKDCAPESKKPLKSVKENITKRQK